MQIFKPQGHKLEWKLNPVMVFGRWDQGEALWSGGVPSRGGSQKALVRKDELTPALAAVHSSHDPVPPRSPSSDAKAVGLPNFRLELLKS